MKYTLKEKTAQISMKATIRNSIMTASLIALSCTTAQAVNNDDYAAVPPFTSTEVKPNILFIIDNSNSMDEDVDGAAVGGTSPLSRSEIARNAIKEIIRDQKDNMRFGLMAYKQENVDNKNLIHNSFYYCSFDPATYNPTATPTPTDPTSNTKRFPNPSDPGNFIYYDVALPFYTKDTGNSFCYSGDYTDDGNSNNDHYWCYRSKTGAANTPKSQTRSQIQTNNGYSNYFWYSSFFPTDSDIAAGIVEFGYEISSVPIGPTWFSNSSPGGGLLHTNIEDSSPVHIADIEAKLATSQFTTATDTPLRNAGLTPIAGTINSARAYFEGNTVDTATGVTATNPITERCQKNYVILLTDGLPSVDSSGNTGTTSTLLAEVKNSITSLRTTNNVSFPNTFDIQTYVIGFAIPATLGSGLDDLAVAGGTAVNGHALFANNAVELGQKLKALMLDISKKVASGSSTSIISNSRSGEGVTYQSSFYPEYTDSLATPNTVTWTGNVSSLFVDSFGNLREDTNENKRFDIEDDYLLLYRNKGTGVVVQRYKDSNENNILDVNEDLNGNNKLDLDLNEDINGNNVLDPGEDLNGNNLLDLHLSEDRNGNELLDQHEDTNNNGKLDPGEDLNGDGLLYTEDIFIDEINITALKYVWDANEWLNKISNTNIVDQRTYDLPENKRYIFTFVDDDRDKVVDPGEQIAFTEANYDRLKKHLIVYPTLTDEPTWLAPIRADGNYDNFLKVQSKRIINFIRGEDQGDMVSATPVSYTLNAMRSRLVDYDGDGIAETWRLGDIIHSGPKAIGAPAEGYSFLYEDFSYGQFADKYQDRRTVVYVGGNDGMIHAFNGGFYYPKTHQLNKYSVSRPEPYVDTNGNKKWDGGEPYTDRNFNGVYDDGVGNETQHELGSELWAYIPYNLLPHLRFLTLPDYKHIYYNDLSPRIFDAKIFTPEPICSTDIYDAACIHPNGWGTVLVAGMRFGGGLYDKTKTWDFPVTFAPSISSLWAVSPDADVDQSTDSTNWIITAKAGKSPHVELKTIHPVGIDADRSKIITIQFSSQGTGDPGAGGAILHWNGGSITVAAPSVDTSGSFYNYTFDMTSESTWSGTINDLRIELVRDIPATKSVALDYIDIVDDEGYSSSYSVIDITNPEIPPTVLAEINTPGLGFTTAMPTVIPIKSKTNAAINDWYLAFGSGPNHNQRADSTALRTATSNTTGKIYVASLNELAQNASLQMLDGSSGSLNSGTRTFAEFDNNTFVSDLVTVDTDLDYDADVVYFGTVSGNNTAGWGGKMRRLVFNDGDPDTTTWTGNSVLFNADPGQTITAAANVGSDDQDNLWVYFGTGRYFVRDDVTIANQQKYYGIKEPVDATNGKFTWANVLNSDLLDTTTAEIFDDKRVEGMGTIVTWADLVGEINKQRGWMIDLEDTGERNLGQAALLGGVLTFTSYIPSTDLCSKDGTSNGYAVYYKTGTAFYKSIWGYTIRDTNSNNIVDVGERRLTSKIRVGRGISFSPTVHVGSDGGSSVHIGTSDGSIKSFEQDNPGLTKSKRTGWKNLTQ